MSVKKNRWRLVAALASSLGCIEDCGHWQFRLLLPDGVVFTFRLIGRIVAHSENGPTLRSRRLELDYRS